MSEKPAVSITPDTRVGAMLRAYPQLESVLIRMSPEFEKLRNPILRKTVAKVATLQQVSKIGGVPLGELINQLRRAAGIAETFESDDEQSSDSQPAPAWFDPQRISDRLDIRPLLEAGEQPLGLVMERLRQLGASDIFLLTAAFVPAPLIEQARKQGFASWTARENDTVLVYFKRVDK